MTWIPFFHSVGSFNAAAEAGLAGAVADVANRGKIDGDSIDRGRLSQYGTCGLGYLVRWGGNTTRAAFDVAAEEARIMSPTGRRVDQAGLHTIKYFSPNFTHAACTRRETSPS